MTPLNCSFLGTEVIIHLKFYSDHDECIPLVITQKITDHLTHLVNSTGELLIIYNNVENEPPLNSCVLEKRIYKIWIWERLQVLPFSGILKHVILCFCLPSFSATLPIEPNFSQVCCKTVCWSTQSEDIGLWHLPKSISCIDRLCQILFCIWLPVFDNYQKV